MGTSLDSLKIPAFKRKRSIRPKKRRHSQTALERRQHQRKKRVKVSVAQPKKQLIPRPTPSRVDVSSTQRAKRSTATKSRAGTTRTKKKTPARTRVKSTTSRKKTSRVTKKNTKRMASPKRALAKKRKTVTPKVRMQKKKPKKPARTPKKVQVKKESLGIQIGTITHYFDKIVVGVIELTKPLKVGDTIRIVGGDRDFTQPVKSMQINREDIQKAKKGDDVGLKLKKEAKPGDRVYVQK